MTSRGRRWGSLGGRSAPHLLVVGAIILGTLVALETGARLVVYGNDAWRPDYRESADGYGGAPWVGRYYKEFRDSGDVDWHPYVYWRRRPYSGEYINVDAEGVRRSWRAANLPALAPAVFVLGGSTVWGTGARDEQTMPSQIARQLDGRGRPVRIVNYGESGYVLRQSLDTVIDRLQRGDVPRVAVFYSGVEDTFSALQNGEPGLPQNEANRRLEFNATQPQNLDKLWHVMTAGVERLGSLARARLVPSAAAQDARAGGDRPGLADSVVATYCSTARVAAALGRQYGFAVKFYWQPVLFMKASPTAYEAGARERYGYARDFFDQVYTRMSRPGACADVEITDLSHLFDRETQPRYIDAFHLTEAGNEAVAGAIVPDVASVLDVAEAK